jgi:hypothetical protein
MSSDTINGVALEDVVVVETALACLFRLGVQNGVYAEIGAVRRRNLIDANTIPVSRLFTLAPEFGLHAECVRLNWDSLRRKPFSHPLMLLLENKNAVVLIGVRRDGEPFFLAREDLDRAWRGMHSSSRRWHRARRTPCWAFRGSRASCSLSAV